MIDDYAETAGKRRKERDTTHGTQPGDPVRPGRATLTAVESAEPPAMLLLGSDALISYRQLLNRALAEADKWEELSVSTDFQDCSSSVSRVTAGQRPGSRPAPPSAE